MEVLTALDNKFKENLNTFLLQKNIDYKALLSQRFRKVMM